MMGISCPCFTAVQEGAEDASSVDTDLSCQGKLPVLPYLFAEPQNGHWSFTNPDGDLLIERERVLVKVAPKYVKQFMTSKGVPSIMTFGGLSAS